MGRTACWVQGVQEECTWSMRWAVCVRGGREGVRAGGRTDGGPGCCPAARLLPPLGCVCVWCRWRHQGSRICSLPPVMIRLAGPAHLAVGQQSTVNVQLGISPVKSYSRPLSQACTTPSQ